MDKPLVSICCITYNHEPYIKDALDGFVMQKTNFPYEIVISDDCSKDRTREIIAEYKRKYPGLIRDVSPSKNIGVSANFRYVQDEAKGKYVALCEGDDYWTDPYKLQKQVNFMESHPMYSLCCHNYSRLNQDTGIYLENGNGDYMPEGGEISCIGNFNHWLTKTLTLMYRREVYQLVLKEKKSKNWRDAHLCYYLLKKRKGYYLPFNGGVYREHQEGIFFSLSSLQKEIINIKIYDEIYRQNSSDKDFMSFYLKSIEELKYEILIFYKRLGISRELLIGMKEIDVLLFKNLDLKSFLSWHRQLFMTGLKRRKMYKIIKGIYCKHFGK